MEINEQTYEEYFLLYIDGELSAPERAAVEEFVKENPEHNEELTILRQSVFIADESITFENKEILYKEEKDAAVVILFGWKKLAVAAAALLFLGAGGWLYINKKTLARDHATHEVVQVKPRVDASTENRATMAPKDQPPVTASISAEENTIKNTSKKILTKKHSSKNALYQQVIADDKIPREDVALLQTPKQIIYKTAAINSSGNKINIPVQARDITSSQVVPSQATIHYADGDALSGDNKIYFANTSFSKKNSLRVVFRKASRIIDRITTLQ